MTITALEALINGCNSKISENNRKIEKYVAAHDSLVNFKNAVTSSQEEFHTGNNAAIIHLSDLIVHHNECVSARKYHEGMEDTLTGIGVKIVGAAYEGLLKSISGKLGWYNAQISFCEANNILMNTQIAGYRADIAAIKTAERLTEVEE